MKRKLKSPADDSLEQKAFDLFRFPIGGIVRHRVTRERCVVVGRFLFQAQTGNTGHLYEISSGEKYIRRFEIELESAL